MEWMNIRVSTIRSPEYMGSKPVERATWINAFAYCVEQENGGRIAGGLEWKDRQWQQCCGVTTREIRCASKLIKADGNDIVIFGYPAEKETEVKGRRVIAADAARKRWEGKLGNASRNASCIPSGNASRNAEREGEREGEREREHEASASTPPGMPKNENEAVDLAGIIAVPADFIRERFIACMAVGFVDGGGRPIKSWPHYLQSSFQHAKQREADAAKKSQKPAGYEPPLKFV